MDKLMFATRVVSMGDESKQNDVDLVGEVQRLVGIIEMLVNSMEDFILEVHISPMNILQSKFSEVKRLKISIVYNAKYTGKELSDAKKDCNDLINAMILDEFSGVDKLDETDYSTHNKWPYPTMLIYTVFGDCDLDDLKYEDKQFLNDLINAGYTLSIPYSFCFQEKKALYIHCATIGEYPALISNMLNSKRICNRKIDEYDSSKDKYDDCVYVPIIGHKPLQYNIPYKYITAEDFIEHSSDDELKQ